MPLDSEDDLGAEGIEIRDDRETKIGTEDARMDRKAFGRILLTVILGAQRAASVGP
jgi:hypothetical protein